MDEKHVEALWSSPTGASPSMPLYCDNINTINISKTPVQYSCTKPINIRHHFIKSLVEDRVIKLKRIYFTSVVGNSVANPIHVDPINVIPLTAILSLALIPFNRLAPPSHPSIRRHCPPQKAIALVATPKVFSPPISVIKGASPHAPLLSVMPPVSP